MFYLIVSVIILFFPIVTLCIAWTSNRRIKKQLKEQQDHPPIAVSPSPMSVNYSYPSGFMFTPPGVSGILPYHPYISPGPVLQRDLVVQQLNERINVLQNQLLEAQQTSTRPLVIQMPPGATLLENLNENQTKEEKEPEKKSDFRALEF